MSDTQPTLLLSRPKAQSVEFLSECEKHAGKRLPVVISPVIRIDPVSQLPDLNAYATLVFTSSNGVAACASDLRGRRVVTVGSKTCALAAQAGANATSLGEDVETFLTNTFEIEGPVLHCRGVHARGDLAKRLRAVGIQADEEIVYDQLAQPPTLAARNLLNSRAKVVVPVFSPRSAQLLSETVANADLHVIAMSAAVAEAWFGPGKISIVSKPTAEEMVKMTVRCF